LIGLRVAPVGALVHSRPSNFQRTAAATLMLAFERIRRGPTTEQN
jgi:hypothetical protein